MRREQPPAEVMVTAALVRRLLRDQHPDLAERPLRRLGNGWDTVVFRSGRDLCVRVPRRQFGARTIGIEARWLPVLAPGLPVAVPTPLRVGGPSQDFPWQWTVCTYVPGRPLEPGRWSGNRQLRAADTLLAFLTALHQPAPPSAPVNPFRGRPLATRAPTVDAALLGAPVRLRARLAEIWSQALDEPEHRGPAVWVHGDLHPRNVLASRGSITGVIDFGDLGGGDPATDLAAAWLLLDGSGRQRVRAGLGVDDATWGRARGWALFFALMFQQHSRGSSGNELIGRRAMAEVLAWD